jgi:hypothetical protein
MNQLAAVLSFLAASPQEQTAALPSLPNESGARAYYADFRHNPLLILIEAYNRFFHHRDDEPWDVYEQRLGIPSSPATWPGSLDELDYVLGTIEPADHTLWAKKALERKLEWRLVRRLARVVLDDIGWERRVDPDALAVIQEQYSSAVHDEWREEGRSWVEV